MLIGRRQFVRLAGAAALAMGSVAQGKEIPFATRLLPRSGASASFGGTELEQIEALSQAAGEKSRAWKGVKAIFVGPAGSARTFAAHMLASEAGRDLYVVDVGRVISKYVGETEKNLERLLAEAERAEVVLFFDEADDLFGKRTDAEGSRARYANLDVAYLVQRIETFEGVAILATNNAANIDEALVRKSDAVINFSTKPIKPPAAQ